MRGGQHRCMNTSAPEHIVVDHFAAVQRSLRIAFVTETYPPEVNGVAMTVARIVEGLHRCNHDVQLIRPRQDTLDLAELSPRFHEVLMRGLPIPRYPNLRMGVPSKRALVQLWSVHRPDVVHIATEGALGWSALHAALHLKLPVSSDFRTNFHAYSRHYGIGWLYKPIMAYLRKFHNRAHSTMVPTEALRLELEAGGFKQLSVVSRGVDIQQFTPARRSESLRAQWGLAEGDLALLHVGRIAPEKNLATLMAAYDAILRMQPSARLIMVGSGPEQAALQARYPAVIFAGQRRGEDLAAHYASADLFLFPSLTETFGNVTPEAMASGLALVAFNYAAAAQLIRSGENGVLVAMDDQAAFVSASLAAAGDASARRQMGRWARQTASELDWASIVARFETVLDTVIQRAEPAHYGPLAASRTTVV
jgi:glycosyltransferase involved in cell wall biosynthesis